jgi:putative selenium metabolism protein SsnA
MTVSITGAWVVRSLDPPRVERTNVIIDDGRVTGLGPAAAGADRPLDAAGLVVIPGNVCAHTHLYSGLARGMPYRLEPPRTFVDILRRVWWRLDRALDAETIRASALVGGMEALLSGTTTLIDHHASPAAVEGSLDIVADAVEGLGLRSVLCYETSDRDGPAVARAGVEENRRFARAVATGRRPLTRAMVGAHASFTLSDDTLQALVEVAGETRTGIHIHAAEDAADERSAIEDHGARVARRLAAAGALGPSTLLAHGVHLDADEVAIVRAAGATVVHNARSNMNNAVGRAPVSGLGEALALGTDGIGADMFEESRVAWLRRREEDGAIGADWALACLARSAGVAATIFEEPLLGRIEVGAPADLVVLDYRPPTPLADETLAAHWMFGIASARVRDVLIAGRLVVRDRRLVGVDAEAIAAAGREAARRLWTRLESLDVHPFAPGADTALAVGAAVAGGR